MSRYDRWDEKEAASKTGREDHQHPMDKERVILVTGRYLGEGFDDTRLDTLFLTLPIARRGTLTQYAGQLHRVNSTKTEVVIYGYVDLPVPVLARMYAKRRAGYKSIGYEIKMPNDVSKASSTFNWKSCALCTGLLHQLPLTATWANLDKIRSTNSKIDIMESVRLYNFLTGKSFIAEVRSWKV